MPLNPSLYHCLEQVFGSVHIANAGYEGQASVVRRPGGGKQLQISDFGESYAINCPFCSDTRHRLYINWRYGQPDPGTDGRYQINYLCTCFNESCVPGDYDNRRHLAEMILAFRNIDARNKHWAVRRGEVRSEILRQAPPPGRLVPLTWLPGDHVAYRYMVGCRCYTREMLDHYQVHYCSKASPRYRAAQGYVIFPIMQEGICVGWQGRYPDDGINWKALGVPKYYTMPGLPKNQILYNYDNAKNKPYVVLAEGVTDVHVIGDHGVAVLGKTISAVQRRKLLETWPTQPIILLFDPDARMEMEGIVRDLQRQRNGAPMFEVHLPEDYDAGDYTQKTLNEIIHARAREVGIVLGSHDRTPQPQTP